jgi:hypothetical protein
VTTKGGWGGSSQLAAEFSAVEAFSLPLRSADAVLDLNGEVPLGPTAVQLSGLNGGTGVGLKEIYDVDLSGSANSAQLVNLSALANVRAGGNPLIAGFVIDGGSPVNILIRAVGPGLVPFGVAAPLATPKLKLYDGEGNQMATTAGWGGATVLVNASAQAGAFPLAPNSLDCAILMTLPPGVYSAEVPGTGGATGLALVEIYRVP